MRPSDGSWRSSPLIGPKSLLVVVEGVGSGTSVGVGNVTTPPDPRKAIRVLTSFIEMASPIPSMFSPPNWEILAVLTPITLPSASTRGPRCSLGLWAHPSEGN